MLSVQYLRTKYDDDDDNDDRHHTSACVRSNFFAERIVNAWNNLPESVDFTIIYLL